MESPVNRNYRLPSYRGSAKKVVRPGPSSSLQVSPSQLALQKTALLRQSLSARKGKEQLSAKLRDSSDGKGEGDKLDKDHLEVYENIPKGLSPKEYQEWAQEWLPRLSSRKGPRAGDTSGFALGHVPALVKGSPDKDPPPEHISGPLVYHFNPNTTREKKNEYYDLYMDYHKQRTQSARSPRKRYTGPVAAKKPSPDDPKWEFLKSEDEPKTVQGARLEIPAWQTGKNTPDTTELNQFLENVKDKTYFSFCQKPTENEKERSRTTTPRNNKSKSAGVKLERLGLRRNKLGILEPPQKLPLKKGSLRQGHSFDINYQRVDEFEAPPKVKLDDAIVPINKNKKEGKVFLTEEDPDATSVPEEGHRRKGKLMRNPVHKMVTRIPTDSVVKEDAFNTLATGDAPMDVDPTKEPPKPGFVISGSRIHKGSTPDEGLKTERHFDPAVKPASYPRPIIINGMHNNNSDDGGNTDEEAGVANGDDIGDLRVTKSRELVIKFSKDDKDRIESIKTVTSERLVLNN